MIGKMSQAQIKALLAQQLIARIGCSSKGKPYVVPVYFAYDDGIIYCQSREGLKLNMMRENPSVCLLIDDIGNLSNWRSAVVWGKFTELTVAPSIRKAASVMEAKFFPLATGGQVIHTPDNSHPPEVVEKGLKAIYFQVKIAEMTGRFEKIQ